MLLFTIGTTMVLLFIIAMILMIIPIAIIMFSICGLLFILSPPRYELQQEQEEGDIYYEPFTGFKSSIAK